MCECDLIHDLYYANDLFTHVQLEYFKTFLIYFWRVHEVLNIFVMKLISNRITFSICFLGIFVSYFIYGVLQENM